MAAAFKMEFQKVKSKNFVFDLSGKQLGICEKQFRTAAKKQGVELLSVAVSNRSPNIVVASFRGEFDGERDPHQVKVAIAETIGQLKLGKGDVIAACPPKPVTAPSALPA